MEYTDTDLQKACDIKQMAIIGKIHNMPWLKSNSQLSGHIKTLQGGTELRNNSLKNKINEETKERIEVVSTSTVSTSPKVNQIDNVLIKSLNEDDNIINKEDFVNLPQKDMETVWNEDVNVPSTLFPDSQCLVMQRLDEQERISMTLAESIVTVQLDQFRLTEEEQSKPTDSHNETDNDWDSVNGTSNLPKSDSDLNNQESSKQCHDNNNNNAKSKSQSTVETKKAVQRTTKVNTKKLNEQKTKKQSGNYLKEPYDFSKQGSKFKDDLLNLCNNENKTSTSTGESKKISVGISPKFIDKYNKVNGYNKQLIMGKATRTKEQQVFKSHFSTFNDSGNNSRSSIGGLDDKSKCVATKFKVCRNESDKKGNELDDTKRCHKVQATRTQSYNFQYNRSKTLIKSQQQQRYLKNVVKSEEISSITNTSDCNNTASTSIENLSKKKCENQQSITNKQVSDIHSTHNVAGKSIKNSNVPECGISERNCGKSSSVSCKRNYQNLANTKNIVERNVKDDQSHTQKFKRDCNVYRRSTTVIPSSFKDLSGHAKTEDNKKNVSDNSSAKDYKVKPVSTVDAKVHCESEGSKVSVYSHKTSNGASNINKTDTLDSSTANNVQSVKSLNSCSNNTKDSVIVNVPENLQVSQVACNKTEVQFVKTEQENTSNNNSNNKPSTSNSDTKSVKFSDNVQEINAMHRSTPSYTDNSMHQNKIPINQFYSNLQNTCNTSNAQQMENHQNVQNKSYFDNNAAQYSNTTSNMQHTERDLQLLDVVQQKPDQTSHITPQNVLSQNNSNACIAMGNRLPYQSMPAMYLSQYNNTQNVPRKTADSTIISQNALISSTSSYNVESQNVLQNDPSTILMHNTQTSVLPPPGFHNHPVTTQHNQWNLPFPDVFLFGNMMNPAPSMNVQLQNSRHVCSTDYSNIQQTGYLQHPMFYVPPICMQSWNPLLQYPAPLFQNSPYANCNAYPNQVLSSANLVDSANCSVSTSIQNNTYKHFQPVQQIENSPNFSVPVKLDSYTGNIQGCKSNNIRMKDNSMEAHARANQYQASVPNEYQNCSHDGQLMVPFSYGIAMDSMARNCPPNVHMQMSQKYAPHALTTANYQRMPETCSTFQNNQNPHNRKDDVSKSDSDCIPPMVSPRECMYYGVNYSRKTDTVQNSSLRSDIKPVTYNIHSINNQHYVPQYQRNNAIYHNSTPKELSTRVTMARGIRKAMDQ